MMMTGNRMSFSAPEAFIYLFYFMSLLLFHPGNEWETDGLMEQLSHLHPHCHQALETDAMRSSPLVQPVGLWQPKKLLPAGRFRILRSVQLYSVIPLYLSGDHLHPFSSIFASDTEGEKKHPRAKLLKFLFNSS